MNHISEVHLSDLRALISNLGKDGGLMSPSVYDTAQALRFSPAPEGAAPALGWLLAQQRPDGGWGNPAVPKTRDVPTLAAILALYTYHDEAETDLAVDAGLAFLKTQAGYWQIPLADDLPVGVELILPRLLEDADALALAVPYQQYAALIPLGHRKRQQITRLNPGAGTPATFSWEAWGMRLDPKLLDETSNVGHNPAATAYWLHLAADRLDLTRDRLAAQQYLDRAARATGTGIAGVMPTAWPIDRYEQAFVLHTLLVAGLLDHPGLEDVVQPQLQDLAATMKPSGLGFSDHFMADGDDTAAAIAALRATGYTADFASLQQFEVNSHFLGYPGEFQASHSLTARAIHAMALFDKDVTQAQAFLVEQQLDDGRWPGDKWHTSWLYGTLFVAFALKQAGCQHDHALQSAIDAIQSRQNPDGGWGQDSRSMAIDTAYGALTLYVLRDCGKVSDDALRRAHHWLVHRYRPFNLHQEEGWLNKQQYAPYRIDWGFELSAMVALSEVVSA